MSAPFNVGAVVHQVHFAFRPDGVSWTAGDSSHEIRAAVDLTTFTPYTSGGTAGSGLTLQAATIAREQASAQSGPNEATIDAEGHLVISRGAVRETLVNSDAGLEQSWTFARSPAGVGDLVVRIAVSGETFVGETATGLHFAGAGTGLGVRFGNATWVDAKGNRTEVPAHYDGRSIAMRVPRDVVDAAAYPAVLDPSVGAEFGMDNPVSVPSNPQTNTAVSFDGTNYLVVWADLRQGSTTYIYGARVSSIAPNTGIVLDPSGIAISSAPGNQANPAVSFDGTNYFVVWDDGRDATRGSTNPSRRNIYGGRLSTSGAVLDGNGVALCQPSNVDINQVEPDVAFDGTNYFVVWLDPPYNTAEASTDYAIFGRFVSPSMTGPSCPSADPDGPGLLLSILSQIMQIGPPIALKTAPRVASVGAGANTLVVWGDSRAQQIVGAQLGTPLSNIPISSAPPSTTIDRPAISFDGTNYLVVWDDNRNAAASGYDIFGRQVDQMAAVLGASDIPISTAPNNQLSPALAFDGTNQFVLWEDQRADGVDYDVYGARVSPGGTVLAADGVGIPIAATPNDAERRPSVATDMRGNLLVAYDRADTSAAFGAVRARARFVEDLPLGTSCTRADECASGFCVDGVCCDSACGGGTTSDCQACGTPAGAPSAGTCAPIQQNWVCLSATECLQAAACMGTSTTCPPQAFASDGTPCMGGARACSGGICMVVDSGFGDASGDVGSPDGGASDDGGADGAAASDAAVWEAATADGSVGDSGSGDSDTTASEAAAWEAGTADGGVSDSGSGDSDTTVDVLPGDATSDSSAGPGNEIGAVEAAMGDDGAANDSNSTGDSVAAADSGRDDDLAETDTDAAIAVAEEASALHGTVEGGGCGCRVAGEPSSRASKLVLALWPALVAVVLARRRRVLVFASSSKERGRRAVVLRLAQRHRAALSRRGGHLRA